MKSYAARYFEQYYDLTIFLLIDEISVLKKRIFNILRICVREILFWF